MDGGRREKNGREKKSASKELTETVKHAVIDPYVQTYVLRNDGLFTNVQECLESNRLNQNHLATR